MPPGFEYTSCCRGRTCSVQLQTTHKFHMPDLQNIALRLPTDNPFCRIIYCTLTKKRLNTRTFAPARVKESSILVPTSAKYSILTTASLFWSWAYATPGGAGWHKSHVSRKHTLPSEDAAGTTPACGYSGSEGRRWRHMSYKYHYVPTQRVLDTRSPVAGHPHIVRTTQRAV